MFPTEGPEISHKPEKLLKAYNPNVQNCIFLTFFGWYIKYKNVASFKTITE